MLLKQKVLNQIAAGKISLVFRYWQRPTVRTGGTLKTSIGVLAIDEVDQIDPQAISPHDAKRAGYASLDQLLTELQHWDSKGSLYRIAVRLEGPDPRIALRESEELTAEELDAVFRSLQRLDQRSSHGPWTTRILQAISAQPGLAAGDLAKVVEIEKERLKLDIRKLKNLGLTESLQPGYRLSPRGHRVLAELETTGS